jgi:anti-sigma B factor antagonist
MTVGNTRFQANSNDLHNDPLVVGLHIQGRFDAEGLPAALSRIDEARERECSRFLIDLEHVSFIGSAGIGIFLSLVEEMRNEGGGVVFSHVPPSILRIFEVLNVLEFLEIVDSLEEALQLLLTPERQPSP